MSSDARSLAGGRSLEANDAELCRRLIASLTDCAIFATDARGHVLSWNAGAERLTGYAASEIRSQHVAAFYLPEEASTGKPLRDLQAAERNGRTEEEGWRVRKDGSHFLASVVITAIRDDQGGLKGYAQILHEVRNSRNAEQSLRASEERFALLVDSVKDYAIFMLDAEGRVATWNQGAQRIKGYTADEIVGQSFTRFYPQEVVAAGFPQHELAVARAEGRFEDEGWRIRKDGSRFWANVVITALHDQDDRLIGFAKVTRDLTARREAEQQARRLAAEEAAHAEALRHNAELARLNEQLEDQAAELEAQQVELQELADRLQLTNRDLQTALQTSRSEREAAERAAAAVTQAYQDLDQFAYVASHDLKAPLRGIANLAQWIQDDLGEQLGAASREHMRLLQGRVHRMEALIDGILTYSRAGRRLNAPELVDTGALVREAIEFLVLPAQTRVEVDEQMPMLEAERVPLQQVFMNLLANAVKYASGTRSDVKIRVTWRDIGDGFEFAVSDNGPGIAPEYHERIWGMFQTLAARDRVEGTGVGLAVVKKVVETRGGRVSVESAPGHGATFRFTWPTRVQGGHE